VRIFLWHVHGGYTNSFVQGAHEYLLPVLPGRGPDGLGRSQTFDWPESVVEVTPEEAGDAEVDVVVLQRPEELTLAEQWLGRVPGRDVPAVYLEHSLPQGRIGEMRHAAADRNDLLLVHVTHFNAVFWDCGTTPTRVIEHGIVDPGYRYSGELPHAVVVVNEPVRRGRVTGTDLISSLNGRVPMDLFGMGTDELGGLGDVAPPRLWDEMARRRVYLHPIRWTSLGFSLLEAMHLGMPVVALAATEVVEAVPEDAGVVSTSVDTLAEGVRRFVEHPEEARRAGRAAREAARARYGLERFLTDWDELLAEVAA
jgi:glycosyl transferase family 1